MPARSREAAGFGLHTCAGDGNCRSTGNVREQGIATMKRSRRVVLTLMGSAAIGAVSMGLVPRRDCGPGNEAVPGPDGRPYCRPAYGGFGGGAARLLGGPP